MIIASYNKEPFAVILPSHQIARDIKSVFPHISTIRLPGRDDNASTVNLSETRDDTSATTAPGMEDTAEIHDTSLPVKFKCIIKSVHANGKCKSPRLSYYLLTRKLHPAPLFNNLGLVENEKTVLLELFRSKLCRDFGLVGEVEIYRSKENWKGDLIPGRKVTEFEFTLKENETIFVLYDENVVRRSGWLDVVPGGIGVGADVIPSSRGALIAVGGSGVGGKLIELGGDGSGKHVVGTDDAGSGADAIPLARGKDTTAKAAEGGVIQQETFVARDEQAGD